MLITHINSCINTFRFFTFILLSTPYVSIVGYTVNNKYIDFIFHEYYVNKFNINNKIYNIIKLK